MKLSGFVLAVVCTLLLAAGPSFAKTSWGSSCSGCHSAVNNDLLNVVNQDTWADPTENIPPGADDRGLLKVFQVAPGATKSLLVEISGLSDGDKYAVQIKRFGEAGVENNGVLVYTPDALWTSQLSGSYFTNPTNPTDPGDYYTWPVGPTNSIFKFDITVDASTLPDYYDLEFALAGKPSSGSKFYGDEHFYLQVIPEPATLAILAIGFAGAAISARRRRKA